MSADDPRPVPRILARAEHAVPAFSEAPPAPDARQEALARALEQARESGYRQAADELEAERRAFAERMAQTLAELAQLRQSLLADRDARVAEVVIEAASRIARSRIDAGDPLAARALREALSALPASSGLRARLHPADLQAAAADLQAEIEQGRIQLVADPTLSRGGCVVHSDVGTIDATVETAVAAVERALGGEPA
jgi:flagellar assembly protein FliH